MKAPNHSSQEEIAPRVLGLRARGKSAYAIVKIMREDGWPPLRPSMLRKMPN